MPALSAEAWADFAQKLDELEPEVNSMKDVPKNFLTDMLEKKSLYGERMFVSPKQQAWVERLHDEFIGTSDPADDDRDDRDPRSDRDMDDDIPF